MSRTFATLLRAPDEAVAWGTTEVSMSETLTARRSLPLTDLSEDERLFRDAVSAFAEERVRPLVHRMDEEATIPRTLIDELFALGVMGVEIPEEHGGAGATFFMSILAVEALARV
ncbi:MAG TPA: acyl-CoA dehydrogenase family protein, partial [Vicinamibacteria bacterium]|nr:acyl-CoA dehydrogenase family protein [Vicinamibacteria bacterium]